jgi:hypothetical protein
MACYREKFSLDMVKGEGYDQIRVKLREVNECI